MLISHPHLDHWGLLPYVNETIPYYMGQAAYSILNEGSFFLPAAPGRPPTGVLADRQPFEIGPYRITPYLADHSAFDAYFLLIEGDRGRLLYSGDFRGHGRKSRLLDQFLANPPRDIEVLLLEGTSIPESKEIPDSGATEEDVEARLIEVFKNTPGIALVAFSAQNIDRLVSVYRAALQSGRHFVQDLYAATVATATGTESIPKPGHDKLKVFVPQAQRVRVKRAQAFERVDAIREYRIYPEDLARNPAKWVMIFRASLIPDLERAGCLNGAGLVWSLWPGYLKPPEGDVINDFVRRHQMLFETVHASGHAHPSDLKRLVRAVKPKRVVPIHTFGADRYDELFPGVEHHPDGEWWEV